MRYQRLRQTRETDDTRSQHSPQRREPTPQPEEDFSSALGNREMGRLIKETGNSDTVRGDGARGSRGTFPAFRGLSGQLIGSLQPGGYPVQAKMAIGKEGDESERQAERWGREMAKQMYAPGAEAEEEDALAQTRAMGSEARLLPTPKIQRQTQGNEAAALPRPGLGGKAAAPEIEGAIERERGKGQPLPRRIGERMGQATGTDFSGVKVHADERADSLNRAVGARAFTTGQDIFFRQGEYAPGSRSGQELIAHELTHVRQQSGGDRTVLQREPLPDEKEREQEVPEPIRQGNFEDALVLARDYWNEFLDPMHRPKHEFEALEREFSRQRKSYDTTKKEDFFAWLLEEEPNPNPNNQVEYLEESERKPRKITFQKTRILFSEEAKRDDKMNDYNGKIIFVLDRQHNFYYGKKVRNQFHHSSLLAGAPVAAAGQMKVKPGGEIQLVDNSSGHYQPLMRHSKLIARSMEEKGADLSRIKMKIWKSWGSGTNEKWTGTAQQLLNLDDE